MDENTGTQLVRVTDEDVTVDEQVNELMDDAEFKAAIREMFDNLFGPAEDDKIPDVITFGELPANGTPEFEAWLDETAPCGIHTNRDHQNQNTDETRAANKLYSKVYDLARKVWTLRLELNLPDLIGSAVMRPEDVDPRQQVLQLIKYDILTDVATVRRWADQTPSKILGDVTIPADNPFVRDSIVPLSTLADCKTMDDICNHISKLPFLTPEMVDDVKVDARIEDGAVRVLFGMVLKMPAVMRPLMEILAEAANSTPAGNVKMHVANSREDLDKLGFAEGFPEAE